MKLTDAIARYLNETFALNDLAETSIRSYRGRIQTFVDFLDNPEIDVTAALTKDNLVGYFYHLRNKGYKPTTIYAKNKHFGRFGAGHMTKGW
jgi:site-specific recombinase XerD